MSASKATRPCFAQKASTAFAPRPDADSERFALARAPKATASVDVCTPPRPGARCRNPPAVHSVLRPQPHNTTPPFIVTHERAPRLPSRPTRRRRSRPGQPVAQSSTGQSPPSTRRFPARCPRPPRCGSTDPADHMAVHGRAELLEAANSSQLSHSPTRFESRSARGGPLVGEIPPPACRTGRAVSRRRRGRAAWDDRVERVPRARRRPAPP